MKRKYLFVVGSIAIISAVTLFTFIQVHSVSSGPQTSTPTPHLDGYQTTQFDESLGTFLPTIPTHSPKKYTDLSPELSVDQKVAVEILHEDGTRERIDMARSMSDDFIKKLPHGDTLIEVSPIYPGSGGYALPTIVDLAPEIPYEDKPSVVVQHPDGTREMFLLAPDTVDAFIQNLPKGDELKSVIPPPAASLTHEAP